MRFDVATYGYFSFKFFGFRGHYLRVPLKLVLPWELPQLHLLSFAMICGLLLLFLLVLMFMVPPVEKEAEAGARLLHYLCSAFLIKF